MISRNSRERFWPVGFWSRSPGSGAPRIGSRPFCIVTTGWRKRFRSASSFTNSDNEMSQQAQTDRVLIVNADDFGHTAAITRGILRAHQHGIVTSTSLMVHGSAAAFAAEHAGDLDLGLHIDLGEWTYRDGEWAAVYERVPLDDRSAVENEIDFQLNEFRRLTGKLPSHLDSHQHVHISEPVLSLAKQIADELDVPLRSCSS